MKKVLFLLIVCCFSFSIIVAQTIFYDDFSRNDNNWEADSSPNEHSLTIEKGKLIFKDDKEDTSWNVLKHDIVIDVNKDFEIEYRVKYHIVYGYSTVFMFFGEKYTPSNAFGLSAGLNTPFSGGIYGDYKKYTNNVYVGNKIDSDVFMTILIRKIKNKVFFYHNQTLIFNSSIDFIPIKQIGFFLTHKNGIELDYIKASYIGNDSSSQSSKRKNNHLSTKEDNTLPKIKIKSPSNNYKTQKQTITIKGKASDASGVFQVLVNNSVAKLESNGNFSAEINLNNIGNNQITIQATDNKLNTQRKTINVVREDMRIVYEKRLALVIGNADYQRDVGDLRNPVNDARDMRDKLKSMHFEVMEYENLTYPQMRSVISQYGKRLKDYEVGLFFYSGHGLASGGENYMIPTDAVLNYEQTVSTECIGQSGILSQMEGAGSAVNIIILDACRNNPFSKSWGRGVADAKWTQVTAPQGTFIAYATSPEKTAHDGWRDNGAYTAELLRYIDVPGLTIEQVFKKVRGAVDRKFKNMRFKQMPWESTSLKGEFFFVKNK